MKKHLKWIIPVAAVVAVVALFALRGGSPTANAGSTENGGEPAPDRSATAEVGDVSVKLNETGVIQPETMVLVKSKVSGKIRNLHVKEGEYVKKGVVLARVEPDMAQARTVATLKSGYGRAKVALERARQDYERDLELHGAGHISDEEFQLSQDDYDIAKIEYQSAFEQMRLAEDDGVSMDLDTDTGELLDVIAPASGTVINVEVEEGEVITSGAVSYTSGTTLMMIADLSKMQIRAGVNEVDVGKIEFGQDVVIDVDTCPYCAAVPV